LSTARFVEFYLNGRLDLDALIIDRLPLERIGDAIAALESSEAARSVIVFD